jgi:hypothetical protein
MALAVITLKLLLYRADYTILEQIALGEPIDSSSTSRTNKEVNTATDLVRRQDKGRTLSI